MSQNKQPLITDMSSLIRGATEKPEPIVMGDKSGDIERQASSAPATRRPPARKEPKPKAMKERGRAPAKESYPWDEANPKVMKFVQVRMPEDLHAKLAWIKANSIGVPSVHDLMLNAIASDADQRIERIKKGDRGG